MCEKTVKLSTPKATPEDAPHWNDTDGKALLTARFTGAVFIEGNNAGGRVAVPKPFRSRAFVIELGLQDKAGNIAHIDRATANDMMTGFSHVVLDLFAETSKWTIEQSAVSGLTPSQAGTDAAQVTHVDFTVNSIPATMSIAAFLQAARLGGSARGLVPWKRGNAPAPLGAATDGRIEARQLGESDHAPIRVLLQALCPSESLARDGIMCSSLCDIVGGLGGSNDSQQHLMRWFSAATPEVIADFLKLFNTGVVEAIKLLTAGHFSTLVGNIETQASRLHSSMGGSVRRTALIGQMLRQGLTDALAHAAAAQPTPPPVMPVGATAGNVGVATPPALTWPPAPTTPIATPPAPPLPPAPVMPAAIHNQHGALNALADGLAGQPFQQQETPLDLSPRLKAIADAYLPAAMSALPPHTALQQAMGTRYDAARRMLAGANRGGTPDDDVVDPTSLDAALSMLDDVADLEVIASQGGIWKRRPRPAGPSDVASALAHLAKEAKKMGSADRLPPQLHNSLPPGTNAASASFAASPSAMFASANQANFAHGQVPAKSQMPYGMTGSVERKVGDDRSLSSHVLAPLCSPAALSKAASLSGGVLADAFAETGRLVKDFGEPAAMSAYFISNGQCLTKMTGDYLPSIVIDHHACHAMKVRKVVKKAIGDHKFGSASHSKRCEGLATSIRTFQDISAEDVVVCLGGRPSKSTRGARSTDGAVSAGSLSYAGTWGELGLDAASGTQVYARDAFCDSFARLGDMWYNMIGGALGWSSGLGDTLSSLATDLYSQCGAVKALSVLNIEFLKQLSCDAHEICTDVDACPLDIPALVASIRLNAMPEAAREWTTDRYLERKAAASVSNQSTPSRTPQPSDESGTDSDATGTGTVKTKKRRERSEAGKAKRAAAKGTGVTTSPAATAKAKAAADKLLTSIAEETPVAPAPAPAPATSTAIVPAQPKTATAISRKDIDALVLEKGPLRERMHCLAAFHRIMKGSAQQGTWKCAQMHLFGACDKPATGPGLCKPCTSDGPVVEPPAGTRTAIKAAVTDDTLKAVILVG